MKIDYAMAIDRIGVIDRLQPFSPVVIGTPPLGIAVGSSDIDIACSSYDLSQFEESVTSEFESLMRFQINRTSLQDLPSVVAQFSAFDWDFELVCQPIPTDEQWGVQHFRVEKRLLELSPELIPRIRELKLSGMKTEPAFAHALGLAGDPYSAILQLQYKDDAELPR